VNLLITVDASVNKYILQIGQTLKQNWRRYTYKWRGKSGNTDKLVRIGSSPTYLVFWELLFGFLNWFAVANRYASGLQIRHPPNNECWRKLFRYS